MLGSLLCDAIAAKREDISKPPSIPRGMGVARLTDLPPEWSRQREMLGLPSHRPGFEPSLHQHRSPSPAPLSLPTKIPFPRGRHVSCKFIEPTAPRCGRPPLALRALQRYLHPSAKSLRCDVLRRFPHQEKMRQKRRNCPRWLSRRPAHRAPCP